MGKGNAAQQRLVECGHPGQHRHAEQAAGAHVHEPRGEAVDGSVGGEHEREAWLELARQRRKGFLGAGLPAWIAALALFSGLNAVALILLAMSSVVLLCLYRIPRQLG